MYFSVVSHITDLFYPIFQISGLLDTFFPHPQERSMLLWNSFPNFYHVTLVIVCKVWWTVSLWNIYFWWNSMRNLSLVIWTLTPVPNSSPSSSDYTCSRHCALHLQMIFPSTEVYSRNTDKESRICLLMQTIIALPRKFMIRRADLHEKNGILFPWFSCTSQCLCEERSLQIATPSAWFLGH